MLNTKKGNEKKCRLVIFLSSVSGRFGPGPSSKEFKYVRIVARFAYSTKENIKNKNFVAHPVVHALKTKQNKSVMFFRSMAVRQIRPW